MKFEMMAIDGNRMIKLQIGGSPCTYWSIAQTRNRETGPSGMVWELFENYLIALEKFKPNFFLYENNKSMSAAIRAEITKRFGFGPVCINSALVSAQNRQRLYWCGKRNPDGTYSAVPVQQPEDKGILLRDILESGQAWNEKSYNLTTRCCGAIPEDTIKRHRHTMVAEPVRIGPIESKVNKKPVKFRSVYEVKNGLITINGKQYAIKLADGFYIIRKLPGTEGKRLQPVPDN